MGGRSTQKVQRFRAAVASPYGIAWQVAEPEVESLIIEELQKLVEKLKVTYKQQNVNALKMYFVFGVNETTRYVEEGRCAALILNKTSKSAAIIQHLPFMAATHHLPCITLQNCQKFAQLFHITSLSSIAIKNIKTEDINNNSILDSSSILHASRQLNEEVIAFINDVLHASTKHVELPFITKYQNLYKQKLMPLRLTEFECTPKVDVRNQNRMQRRINRKKRRKCQTIYEEEGI